MTNFQKEKNVSGFTVNSSLRDFRLNWKWIDLDSDFPSHEVFG